MTDDFLRHNYLKRVEALRREADRDYLGSAVHPYRKVAAGLGRPVTHFRRALTRDEAHPEPEGAGPFGF